MEYFYSISHHLVLHQLNFLVEDDSAEMIEAAGTATVVPRPAFPVHADSWVHQTPIQSPAETPYHSSFLTWLSIQVLRAVIVIYQDPKQSGPQDKRGAATCGKYVL
jgi:hypothetical protein